MSKSPFVLHRAALAPLLLEPGAAIAAHCRTAVAQQGEQAFAEFISSQGMAPLWHEHLASVDDDFFSSSFREQMKAERFNATAAYLLQKHGLETLRRVLDERGIVHAVFKGAHFRELIYAQPGLRVASDIDLLVSPADRFAAASALREAGFEVIITPSSISHELTLAKGFLAIDLHWDIMRPGHTRVPLVDEFLQGRVDYKSHWGVSPEATLFLMLVHPVITKYCTSPMNSVIRVLDIVLWVEQMKPDWDKLAQLLERAGLKTAAWIMLEWMRLLTGKQAPEAFVWTIRPGPLRRRYLAAWIAGDYSTRLLEHLALLHLLYSLPCYDRPTDALRAVLAVFMARLQSRGVAQNAEILTAR